MNAGAGTEATVSATPTKASLLQPSWPAAFRGVWSLTWKSQLSLRRLPLLVGTLLIIPLLAYFTVDPGRSKPYFHWVIDFYLLLLLPLYCLSVCGGMIRDELQSDTLGFLTTRPVSRARLFLIKYFCHTIWLQALAAIHGGLLVAVGFIQEIPEIRSVALLLLGAQVLIVLAYGALSALLGLVHQRYMVVGILYGFVVEMGIGRIPTNINNLSLSRHLRAILGENEALRQLYEWTDKGASTSVLLMGAGAILFLGLAALVFTVKEYHSTEEMQK
jgi:ABC-type transport system involved in multi-copper enzyme maturation permease subunit